MNHKRPVNLDLASLKFPPTAIVSILHRLSGIALFLLMPVMLYLFHLSLRSEDSFNAMMVQIQAPHWKAMLWIFSMALVYHLLAGIRHILMDIGFAETLSVARKTAVGVVLLSVLGAVYLGVIIW